MPSEPQVEPLLTNDAEHISRVAWSSLILYAVPLAPAYLLYMMLTVVFMNFATDVLLIAPGFVGTIFFVSKIWDAVSDPLVGTLSDATTSRWGRRKSWMLASVVPLLVTTAMLWTPPSDLSEIQLLLWVGVSVLGFYTAFTLLVVPQMALGVELSPSPNERARVFAGRQVAQTLGMLGTFLIATPMILDNVNAQENATNLSVLLSLLLAVTIVVSVLGLPPERDVANRKPPSSPLSAVRDVVRNPHARLLLVVYFIEVFGIGATSAMTPYLLIYVTKASDYIGLVFLFYTIPAFLSIPLWVWLGKRYERHKLWRFAMGLQAIGYGLIVFQEEGRIGLMIGCSVLNGFATACGQTLGYAIKGDVIDYDEYQTGERKEGTYLAAWNLAAKLGTGLMIAFSGWALELSGFIANQPQTERTLWTIKGMTGGAPFVCLLIGMVLFSRFSLGGEEAARIRSALARRRAAAGDSPDA